MPKVSVIIPVYNAELYLKKCLDSVINQSLQDIEIICVNDGSTDNSLKILEQYKEKDSRIKVVINNTNQGGGLSRNIGIEIANGEFVHFMDADDYIESNFYEILYNYAKNNDSDICICDIRPLTEIPNYANGYFELNEYFNNNDNPCFSYKDIKDFLFKKSWGIWNELYKTSFLKKYNIRFSNARIFHDGSFYFESIFRAKRISFVNQKLYNYNVHSLNSLTNKANETPYLFDFFVAIEALKKAFIKTRKFKEFQFNFYELVLGQIKYRMNKTKSEKQKELFLNKSINYINRMPSRILKKLKNKHNQNYYFLINKSGIEQDYKKVKDSSDKIHIVFSCNNNYAQHLAVTIASILKNSKKDEKFVFYILDGGISEENKYKINLLSKIRTFEKFYIKIDEANLLDAIQDTLWGHFSKEVYFRFLIPVLFKHLSKILYLDIDIVVKRPLSEFYNTDFDDTYAIVVKDACELTEHKKKLNLLNYFNSGVMLINNKRWIKEEILNTLLANTKKLKNENKILYVDQDVFNYTFKENVKFVSPKYNLQSSIYRYPDYAKKAYGADTLKEAQTHPVIIHYTTDKKPWTGNSYHELYKEYFKYLKLTAFYPHRNKVKKILQNIFSIKNSFDKKHKVITLTGIKLKIKRRGN